MQNTFDNAAVLWGAVLTLPVFIAFMVRWFTQDEPAQEQRASYLAVFFGILISESVIVGEWMLGEYGDNLIASYLFAPCLLLTLIILFMGTPKLYRSLGGGVTKVSEQNLNPNLPARVDSETRAQQEQLWEHLRDLPHFRETLEGELISLITGDRIAWDIYQGEPCLTIEFSTRTYISVCRIETLRKYVAVQSRIADLLGDTENEIELQGAKA